MNDLARLGLAVDSSQVKRSSAELKRFALAGREADTSAKRVEGSAAKMGAAMGKAAVGIAATIATVQTIRKVTSTIAGFEGGMAKVAAISGATGDELARLRDTAREMGATTEFSASQAADALGFLSMAGFEAKESIAAIPMVLDLATASGMGLAEAADIASNVMSGFGIEAANTARVTDVLAKAASISNTNVSQLGQAMTYAAPVSKALGVSIEQTAAAIGVLSDAGVQGGRAGNTLRTMLSKLAVETDKGTEALKTLNLTFADIDPKANNLEAIFRKLADSNIDLAAATKLVGIEAASNLMILTDSVGKVAGYTDELDRAEGATKSMAETMRDQLGGDLRTLASVVEDLILTLGDAGLTKVLRTVIKTATLMVSTTAGAIQLLADNADLLAVSLGLLAASRIPALIGSLGSLVTWAGSATTALLGSAAATQAFAVALNMLPGVAIFTGLAVAITGTLRAFRDTKAAAEGLAEATEKAAKAQEGLNKATERYYREMTRSNLEAMLIQAKQSRDAAQEAVNASLKRLEVAEKINNFLWLGIGSSKAIEQAKEDLAEWRGELMKAEAELDGAGSALTNFIARFGDGESNAERLAAALGKVGESAYESIPAFDELRETYGALAGEIELLMETQNALAVSDWQKSISGMVVDVDALAEGMGEGAEYAERYAEAISLIGKIDGIDKQAKAMNMMAVGMAHAAGGAENLTGAAREVYDWLRQNVLEGAELAHTLDVAESGLNSAAGATGGLNSGLGQAVGLAAQLISILGQAPSALAAIGGQVDAAVSSLKSQNSAIQYQLTQGISSAAAAIKVQRDQAVQLAHEQGASVDKMAEIAMAFDEPIREAEKYAQSIEAGNEKLREMARVAAGGGSKGGGGAAGAANRLTKEMEALNAEIQQLEFNADPVKKYNHELERLNKLMATGKLSDGAYQKAVQDLTDGLADQIPMVNDVAQAWGDFVARGFQDFKGFANSILKSFQNMLAQMIAMAARNRIMISLGMGGGGMVGTAAQAAGGLMGGGGGAGGMLGNIGAIGGIGSALAGGFMNAGSALMSGGLSGMMGSIGAQAGTALATGTMTSIAATVGAIALPIAGIALAVSFFKKSTKQLDQGLRVTVKNMDAFADEFKVIQTKRFWGLSKKTRTHWESAGAEMNTGVQKVVNDMGASVLEMAGVFGVAEDALDKFSASFQFSTKGMSEEAAQKKIEEELGKFASKMVDEAFSEIKVVERQTGRGSSKISNALMAMFGGAFQEFADRPNSIWGGILSAIGKQAGTSVKTVKTLSSEFAAIKREGEESIDTLTRVYTALLSVNDVFDILGHAAYDATLMLGDVASTMVDAFGGLEAMGQFVGAYWESFYTEEERLETATRRLNKAMEDLGLTMPDSRDGFRALVESIDVSTKEGAELYAELIKLSGAFAEVTPSAEALAEKINRIHSAIRQILLDNDLMPTSSAQHAARNALQINESRALKAASEGDSAAVQRYLREIRASSVSDVAYREVAARVLAQLGEGLPSFSGGGYTGSGPRTGGIDGEGGFLSIMHPQERVIDGHGGDRELVSEIRTLRKEVTALREESRQLGLRADRHGKDTADTLAKWDAIGLPKEQTDAGN